MTTKIEWTDATWNPTTGCNKVSEGCKNCYAEKMHPRLMALQPDKYGHKFLDGAFPHEPSLEFPLHWKKPRMVFVNSMSDLFHESIPFEFIDKVFAIMALCPQHTFQILTKRPERAVEYSKWVEKKQSLGRKGLIEQFPLPNVWIGTSVENQQTADERIPQLLQIPAAVRFLSCEPLLGNVDLKNIKHELSVINALTGYDETLKHNSNNKLHGVICGGELGSKARPMHPDWARKLRDDCKAAGVPFFFNQWGEWITADEMPIEYYKQFRSGTGKPWQIANFQFIGDSRIFTYHKLGKKASGRLLDGVVHNEMPSIKSWKLKQL